LWPRASFSFSLDSFQGTRGFQGCIVCQAATFASERRQIAFTMQYLRRYRVYLRSGVANTRLFVFSAVVVLVLGRRRLTQVPGSLRRAALPLPSSPILRGNTLTILLRGILVSGAAFLEQTSCFIAPRVLPKTPLINCPSGTQSLLWG
jgi:hypothetical protein